MLGTARRLLRLYEDFLRIDASASRWDVMRARATYTVAWVFALLQGLNLIGMTYSYGRWTTDHTASAVASITVVICVSALRWSKNFGLYAAAFVVISVLALVAASVPHGTGINSALLPFLIVAPVVVAFIQGWRAAVALFVFALFLLSGLYWVSVSFGGEAASLGPTRDFQRYVQAMLAVALCTAVSALLSANARQAVNESEKEARRAQRAEAAKADFLATMSHELRTPLNGVIGLAAALSDGALGDRERKLSETIKGSGETLLVLLNDILDLSKIDAGKFVVEPRVFAPASVIASVTEGFMPAAAEKGLDLTVKIDPDVPSFVSADDLRLRQILNNLLSNAVKFTQKGGVTLHMRASPGEEDGPVLVFTVEDTGIGVPPAQADRIFEAFEQGESGITRRYGGTGLGLAICRRLAERMGGTVLLKAKEAPGAAFEFTLPVASASAPPGAAPPPAPAESALCGLRVLAAEDHPVNRMVLAEFLRAEGIEPVMVEDGEACLAALETAEFDLLLLDRHMPKMGGEDVLREMRNSGRPYADMPVVAVTADAMAGERERLLAAGMDDFVSKPLRPATLKDAMLRALGKKGRPTAAAS